jgi:hypothetical protein
MQTRDSYEFDQRQNALFASLASAMSFVGVAMAIPGVLLGAAALIFKWTSLGIGVSGVLALLLVAMGLLQYRAAGHFRRIVRTQGGDVDNLMAALDELRAVYDMERWLWIVVAAVVLVALAGTVTGYSH